MNTDHLVELYESEGADSVREALREGPSLARGLPLARVFESCFGADVWNRYRNQGARESMGHGFVRALTEAEGAVSTSAFLSITGQIVYSWVMDPLPGEEDFPFSAIIPESGPVVTLQEEKIPGLTQLGNVAQVRYEADPYALAGFGEDWIHRPQIRDRGFIVPLTWEAVFEDKTGQIETRAREGGYSMRLNREYRAIDCVIDENTTAHRYKWRGTTIASYGDNSGTHSWDNLSATTTLTDWGSIDTVKQVFNALTDPYTGEPLNITPRHLVAAMGLEQTALRILSATEIRVGDITTGTGTQTIRSNPYLNYLKLVTSRRVAPRLATDTSWFVGDLTAYARYFWAERLDVTQAPPDHPDNFHRRIVQQFRVNERGEYVVVQPRAMVTATVA